MSYIEKLLEAFGVAKPIVFRGILNSFTINYDLHRPEHILNDIREKVVAKNPSLTRDAESANVCIIYPHPVPKDPDFNPATVTVFRRVSDTSTGSYSMEYAIAIYDAKNDDLKRGIVEAIASRGITLKDAEGTIKFLPHYAALRQEQLRQYEEQHWRIRDWPKRAEHFWEHADARSTQNVRISLESALCWDWDKQSVAETIVGVSKAIADGKILLRKDEKKGQFNIVDAVQVAADLAARSGDSRSLLKYFDMLSRFREELVERYPDEYAALHKELEPLDWY
ncbi:MAG TPA: hypothetical protein VI612_01545 [Candidatus Nanoarchaeia archaeon]|nr:hypothetical protein [Candidatus Nanoarchaeia archaeon]